MKFSVFSVAIAAVLCLSLVGGVAPAIAQEDETNETQSELVDGDLDNLSASDLEGIGKSRATTRNTFRKSTASFASSHGNTETAGFS